MMNTPNVIKGCSYENHILKCDNLESAMNLGANTNYIDQFGCSPAQHAFSHQSTSHYILCQIARVVGSSPMFQSRTIPGLAVRRALEARLVSLPRGGSRACASAHASEDALKGFVARLRSDIPDILNGEPSWVKQVLYFCFILFQYENWLNLHCCDRLFNRLLGQPLAGLKVPWSGRLRQTLLLMSFAQQWQG